MPEELDGRDGLIIPGGESATISKLMISYDLTSALQQQPKKGIAIFGTGAGMILLAKEGITCGVEQPGQFIRR